MESPLFRGEVVQARQAAWVGRAQQAQPPRAAWASAFAVLMCLAVGAWAHWGEWQRKVTVPGVLVPPGGLVQLAAPQSGVIVRWLVAEGDDVAEGQALAEIRAERHSAHGEAGALVLGSLAQRRSSLEAELRWTEQQAEQRRRTLSERLESLQVEAAQAGSDATLAGHRVQLARQTLQRFGELAGGGFVSAIQEQQKHEELLELQTREGAAQRAVHGLRRELQAVQAELDGHARASAAALEPLRRALSMLGQEEAELRSRIAASVMAPKSGRVGAIVQTSGQAVAQGQAVGHLVPHPAAGLSSDVSTQDAVATRPANAPLEAHLFVPTRAAGFVRTGQPAWLRIQAFPYQKFGMVRGTVTRVNDAPVAAQELSPAQAMAVGSGAGDALIRVVVALERPTVEAYGSVWPLKPGSVLEADVVQDSRAVWEWIFEPLLAAGQRARLATPGGST